MKVTAWFLLCFIVSVMFHDRKSKGENGPEDHMGPTLWRGGANLGPYSDVHVEGPGPFYPTRQSFYVKNHVTVLEIPV